MGLRGPFGAVGFGGTYCGGGEVEGPATGSSVAVVDAGAELDGPLIDHLSISYSFSRQRPVRSAITKE